MKVKLLTGMVRVEGVKQTSFAPGTEIDVPADEAAALIETNQAVSAEPAKPVKKTRSK